MNKVEYSEKYPFIIQPTFNSNYFALYDYSKSSSPIFFGDKEEVEKKREELIHEQPTHT